MIFLELFWEFFKIGLFAVGGGAATLPFLMDLAEKKPWFTVAELTDMVAVSESTPGPLGVNMATFAGYHAAGVIGGIVATLSLVLPSVIIILIIARFLKSFGKSEIVQGVFTGIRPGVAALIAVAVYGLLRVSLLSETAARTVVNWQLVIIFVIAFALMQIKKFKKFHPLVWIAAGAVIGLILKL